MKYEMKNCLLMFRCFQSFRTSEESFAAKDSDTENGATSWKSPRGNRK